ncbi:hypothetical protein niasHS_012741 [Heterodera schachtii]|uniref:Ubiquinol-cytochrome c chaperone domain-containing protein n=1 Tax=Heterodera schachtii TaxID=97005 RepID=A0ABD2IJC7_HETSC
MASQQTHHRPRPLSVATFGHKKPPDRLTKGPKCLCFWHKYGGPSGPQWLTKRSFEKTVDTKTVRILLLKSANQMYLCCANKYPFIPLLNGFGLSDHYSSWYRLTLLHIWVSARVPDMCSTRTGTLCWIKQRMALCRVQQSLEAMAYIYFMHQVLEVFNTDWYNRLDTAAKEMGMSVNKRKEGMTLHAIYISTLHDYDEGFFGDDRVLAAAV